MYRILWKVMKFEPILNGYIMACNFKMQQCFESRKIIEFILYVLLYKQTYCLVMWIFSNVIFLPIKKD